MPLGRRLAGKARESVAEESGNVHERVEVAASSDCGRKLALVDHALADRHATAPNGQDASSPSAPPRWRLSQSTTTSVAVAARVDAAFYKAFTKSNIGLMYLLNMGL